MSSISGKNIKDPQQPDIPLIYLHRYRLMDVLYTAFHQANTDGTPVVSPMWYYYPKDTNTFPIDLQFFFGDSILVSPVTEENSTSVTIYLPDDTFYDFDTMAPVQGQGTNVTLDNISITQIPLHIRGGTVLPLRQNGTMTTTELRKTDYQFIVAPGSDGSASGSLYVDDGESIVQSGGTTEASMSFKNGKLTVGGRFGYKVCVDIASVRFLGVMNPPRMVSIKGKQAGKGDWTYDGTNKILDVNVGLPLGAFDVEYS
jgi:alpha-glucosidase